MKKTLICPRVSFEANLLEGYYLSKRYNQDGGVAC